MKMKAFLFCFIFFFGSFKLSAQADWENPAVFERNQTLAHTPLVPYTSLEAALSRDKSKSQYYQSLNGSWDFKWYYKPSDLPEDFFRQNFSTKGWDKIEVPSNWQFKGYDYPKFRNISLTFPSNPPEVPDFYNPVGLYRRNFSVPSTWSGRQVFLHFEGVKSASYIWVNGKEVGYNEGGMEPAEFDITPFLKKGNNQLTVQVLRYSDGTYLENQDMWRLSGIYRSVYLFAAPKVHMRDYYVVTDFDENYQDAILKVEVDLANYGAENSAEYQVRLNLLDQNQKNVWELPQSKENLTVASGSSRKVSFELPVKNPAKWSAEKPDLYFLTIELLNSEMQPVEIYAHRLGFRETEIKGNAIYVNGKPIKFNGVNSHVHHPETGKQMPLETIRQDFLLMKKFNINLVRTSHYPPNPEYLDLADEIGMYIVDEAGTECHANEYLSEMTEWKEAFVDRGRKMVLRDRNHPSVVFWSAGNEAGVGENLKALIETGKQLDPSRPGWMYGGNTFYIPFEDIIGPRYWLPLEIKKLAEQDPAEDSRPSFMDEYLAATGNSMGGLDEYWDLIWRYPRLTGGAIWDWISPGISMKVQQFPDRSGNGLDGTMQGRVVRESGPSGQSLFLSGHDEWVELYRDPKLDISGSALTLQMMVKPLFWMDQNPFLTKGSHQYGLLQPFKDSLEFYVYGNERISAKAKVPDNWYDQWHRIAGVYDGRNLNLYIDGKRVATTPYTGLIQNTPWPVCIGRNAETQNQGEHPGWLAHAWVDEVKIYNRALSEAELSDASNERSLLLHLNFENVQENGSFFTTGLGGRTYGLVWPDRAVQPELFQVKKAAQPVKIEKVNLEQGLFLVTNRHNFTDLSEFEVRWKIESEGKIVAEGPLALELAPGESKEILIPMNSEAGPNANDRYLTISFHTAKDKVWALAGHEVAFEQFHLPVTGKQVAQGGSAGKPVQLNDLANRAIVKGDGFEYVWDKITGDFISLKVDGLEMLRHGLNLNVWRAPTANEQDPWNNYNFEGYLRKPGLGASMENHWRSFGIDSLIQELSSFKVRKAGNDAVEIEVLKTAYTSNRNGGFESYYTYLVKGDGTISLKHKVNMLGELPVWLPKLGLQMEVDQSFDRVTYYGRGPFENYPDRKTAAKMGLYTAKAADFYVPYLIPQEHGNRTDVYWTAIQNESGKGIRISSERPFNHSVSVFSQDNLTRALYPFQLKRGEGIVVNVDYMMSGLGDTSRMTMTNYRTGTFGQEFNLVIQPVRSVLPEALRN